VFYIYRNLHKGATFSIRERGIVVDWQEAFVAYNCHFKVNEKGRQRVIRERHKNVHAFVVADRYLPYDVDTSVLLPITYNPYVANTFMCGNEPINTAATVAFKGGRCFLLGYL